MLNKEVTDKIDLLIKERFSIIYEYNFDGMVLLYGGANRDVVVGNDVKDLDFVILTQGECQIVDFIKKFNLKYVRNAFGGYKILYNNNEIDMFSTDDLFIATVYDSDMFFYDIHLHSFITCGVCRAVSRGVITEINNDKEPLCTDKKRLNKIINFVRMTNSDVKKVRVKQNKLLWEIKWFRKRIRLKIGKIKNDYFIKCLRFIKDLKKEVICVLSLGLLISIISVFIPIFSGKLVTELLFEDYIAIFKIMLLMGILILINTVIQYVFSQLYLKLNKKIILNIRKELACCVLNFEMNDFNGNNRGVFIDKLKSDPNEIARMFNSIKEIFVKGLGNFGALLYIFYYDIRLGLIFLMFMVIIFKIKVKGIKKRYFYRKEYYLEQEKYSGVLGEMINGMGDIKELNLKDNYIKRIEKSFFKVGENEYKGNYYQNVYNRIASFLEYVAICVVLVYGLFLVKKGELDASVLVVIYMYKNTLFVILNKIANFVGLRFDFVISCNRIFSILESELYMKESFGDKYNLNCLGKIEFSDVKFRYQNDNSYVINGCSFIVNPMEMVFVVGRSGVGKTTILNLITKLYNATDGVIKIDDEDISEYNEKFIRENVAIISQNPYFFDMSIRDNLKLVNENISDSEIDYVCKLVCLYDFVQNLPKKYDTIIGEGGIKLSIGQKQRLGIARALIKKSKIILLDEITSALDNETVLSIHDIIKNISGKCTIIMVTHDVSLISDDSRVLVLGDGKILADGLHRELIISSDEYRKMYKVSS